MIISAIVARSRNNIIGINNKLPWHLPGDMKFFREKTMGRHVLMGRKSFQSLPGTLKGRTIIIVTGNKNFYDSSCIVKHTIESALVYAKEKGESEIFILGGGEIYEATKELWDILYITDVEANLPGDTTFVDIDLVKWHLDYEHHNESDTKNLYDYTFRIYTRIR